MFPTIFPAMTPFGLRKRIKGAVKAALGMDPPETRTASPSSPPPATKAAPAPAPSPPPPPPKAAAAPKPPPPPPAPAPAQDANLPPGTMWVQGARLDEVLPNSNRVVTVLGRKIALFSVDGELFATENACPHAGGQLGEGDLDGHTITCPFHAFEYDVRTGECLGGQADAVKTVSVKVDGNLVLFEV
jgi:nitrite reductase (NADH) small subunit